MRLRWTEDAFTDLQRISTWIENDRSGALASKVCRRIYDSVRVLRVQPAQGRLGSVSGTRELVVVGTPYIVVYRVTVEAVELLRILHGAQQWPPSS